MALLEVTNVSRHFGGLAAVNKVDLVVEEGEIVGLIGPNGAGKSTMLNLIDGTLKVSSGTIMFQGHNITRYPPHRRAHLGIARVFQKNALFKSMTVLENVLAGSYLRTKHGPWGVFGRSFEHVRRQPEVVARCMETAGLRRARRLRPTSSAPICPMAASGSCAWRWRSPPTLHFSCSTSRSPA